MEKPTILIVDDDKNIRTQLEWALCDKYEVLSNDGSNVLDTVYNKVPNVVLLDLHLPPEVNTPVRGLDILSSLVEHHDGIKVIVISGNGDNGVALRTVDMGAYDYLTKPINLDELKVMVKRALYIQKLEQENNRSNQQAKRENRPEEIIGNSPQMEEVYYIVDKVADTDATVLLMGENGTGKELIAKAIHYRSSCRNEPFQVINCGAIPEQLLETELFGHEKGSFTGAYERKLGKIELAHQGTVFLDEIGELSLPLQVKLLRFLQEREIERVGGTRKIRVNVRVIAASNKDLKQGVKNGTFREDLYYRINVISINLPPLRKRGGDILLLAEYFLKKISKGNVKGFTKSAQEALNRYRWPGNVRELRNTIERAVILSPKKFLSAQDLELDMADGGKLPTLKEAKAQLERKHIMMALQKTQGNLTQAARLIGVNRTVLTRLVQRYGIERKNV